MPPDEQRQAVSPEVGGLSARKGRGPTGTEEPQRGQSSEAGMGRDAQNAVAIPRDQVEVQEESKDEQKLSRARGERKRGRRRQRGCPKPNAGGHKLLGAGHVEVGGTGQNGTGKAGNQASVARSPGAEEKPVAKDERENVGKEEEGSGHGGGDRKESAHGLQPLGIEDEAWAELIVRVRAKVRPRLRSAADVDDVVQETVLTLLQKEESWLRRQDLCGLAAKIAKDLCADLSRSQRRVVLRGSFADLAWEDESENSPLEILKRRGDPRDFLRDLKALANWMLADRQGEVFKCLVEGETQTSSIARIMQVSLPEAHQALRGLKKKLMKSVQNLGESYQGERIGG